MPVTTDVIELAGDDDGEDIFIRSIDMTRLLPDSEPELMQIGSGEWDYVQLFMARSWSASSVASNPRALEMDRCPHTYLPLSKMTESRINPGNPAMWQATREAINDAYSDAFLAEHVKRRWQALQRGSECSDESSTTTGPHRDSLFALGRSARQRVARRQSEPLDVGRA